MSDSDEKFIAISINKEIKNLCPDLEEEQQITLANIIDSEFNMEVIYKELERHIVGVFRWYRARIWDNRRRFRGGITRWKCYLI